MSTATATAAPAKKRGSGLFQGLQKVGRSLQLPIAVLPAAGILLRLGQPDVFGKLTASAGTRSPPSSPPPAARSSTACRCCSASASPSASPRRPTAPPRWPPLVGFLVYTQRAPGRSPSPTR